MRSSSGCLVGARTRLLRNLTFGRGSDARDQFSPQNGVPDRIPANNVEALRRAKRWSMERLGDAIGTDASTINKIEKRKMRINTDRLVRMAEALEVSPNDILTPSDPNSATTLISERPLSLGVTRMPVMGTTAASLLTGSFRMSEGPVDWIDRPKALENARGIYALYVTGTTMSPMFRHGSLLVASEFKPARIGDAILVQERRSDADPILASIGILEEQTSDKIVLGKLNSATARDVATKHVVAVHKIWPNAATFVEPLLVAWLSTSVSCAFLSILMEDAVHNSKFHI
jgi:transcriptional regulator with XRE-family HTH domain